MSAAERDCMTLLLRLSPEHEKQIDAIIDGARLKCERPGNAAFGLALRLAARLASERARGCKFVELVFGDGHTESLDLERLLRSED